MILRQKYRNQFLLLVLKLKHDCICHAKKLALTLWWTSTNKIIGTQHHHKLILHSSCHVQRVLVVATKVEQGTIRVGNERLLVITSDLIARELDLTFWWPSKKQNNRHTTPSQTHIAFIMPRSKGIGSCHKSWTEKNQGRQWTTPRDNWWFNRNDCHSKCNKLSLPVMATHWYLS